MKYIYIILCLFAFLMNPNFVNAQESENATSWQVQSIDTMKFSRDLAREKRDDASFNKIIDEQVKNIADTGATHIALGTPYDEEFVPYLKKWVESARKHNLKVWFRGNFSGWEGWFGYAPISREEHLLKTEKFIIANQELFHDGDIFTGCPECENGGPGDPRLTGDVGGFTNFLIDSKTVAVNTFSSLGKRLETGYFSMNGDVARLIMTKETTKKLGGIVTVDHYVESPEGLEKDIKEYMELSGGKVVLGEYGAPIDDIHGQMTEEQQSEWIENSLKRLVGIEGLVGINYWTNAGSSTHLWEDDGKPRLAADTVTRFYSPVSFKVNVSNGIGQPLNNVELEFLGIKYFTNDSGQISIKYIMDKSSEENHAAILKVSKEKYLSTIISINQLEPKDQKVLLEQIHESLFFKIKRFFYERF